MADPVSRPAIVILAAGLGTRMQGGDKLLMPVGGVPLIRRTVAAATEAEAGDVLLICGHRAEAVAAAIAGLGATVIDNADFARGMGTSIACAMRHCGERPGVMVMPGDMPFCPPRITAMVAARLMQAVRDGEKAVVFPLHEGRRGHPVGFTRHFFARLASLAADQGGSATVAAAAAFHAPVPCDDAGAFFDVDDAADWQRACSTGPVPPWPEML